MPFSVSDHCNMMGLYGGYDACQNITNLETAIQTHNFVEEQQKLKREFEERNAKYKRTLELIRELYTTDAIFRICVINSAFPNRPVGSLCGIRGDNNTIFGRFTVSSLLEETYGFDLTDINAFVGYYNIKRIGAQSNTPKVSLSKEDNYEHN